MPYLPDLPNVEGTHRPAAPSTSGASAAGRGLMSVGNAVSEAGDGLGAYQQQLQKQRDFAAESRAALNFQKELQEHEQFRETNPPENWEADMTTRLSRVRQLADKESISREGRQRLNLQMDEWNVKYGMGAKTDALKSRRATDRTDIMRLYEAQMRAGQFPEAEGTLNRAEESGNFHKGELDPDRVDFGFRRKLWDDEQADKSVLNEIAADPAGWFEQYKDKAPDGMEASKYQRFRDYAKSELRKRTVEDSDAIQDAIFDTRPHKRINTPEDIEHLGGDLRPSVRQQLKETLAKRQAMDFETRKEDPVHQNEVIGQIGTLLRDWNPQDDKFDERYVQIGGLLRSLPTGSAVREELDRQVNAVRQGHKLEATDRKSAAFKALDSFDKRMEERLPKANDLKTADLVKQGFLKDKDKLKRLGFDDGQASTIMEAAKEDPAKGQRAFIDAWGERDAGNVSASQIEADTADAIRLENPTIKWKDPESLNKEISAQEAFYRASGERRVKLADFLKRNPDATQDQIDAKVRDIADGQAVQDIRTSMLPPRPSRRRVAVDVKLSNYGYASDSTPDSHSARGIGHANNKLTDGVSVAISKSFASRYGLRDGDELEIETTKGNFRVKYDDTVPASDSRTGDLPETIDIYRKDGSNNWGGRVTGFSKL